MFDLKPDYAESQRRIDAFWNCELIDRPVVQFSLDKPPAERVPLPVSGHTTPADRWLDADYQAELAWATLRNREFLGDTLPVAYPNLGPEVFSSFYGCPLFFGDYGTSWSEPILHDWAEVDQLALDWQHPYLHKLHDMTDALLELGRGHFITGMTDWHPGGDCLAAFRDPKNLALDMIDHVAEVKALLARIEADYFAVYDMFYAKLRAAGQPIASWIALPCSGKFYIPSNDFSIMISNKMYREVFLPGIVNECRFLDRSIYHLDGPKALRHLDSLLAIPELTALQFVPGAGNEGFAKWVDVYRKAQAAGKAIMVYCTPAEIDLVIETLDPSGVYLQVEGVDSRETGVTLLQRVQR
jgi:hypothetical protein